MLTNAHKPILGFAAYSGVGKTTLLKKLIPLLLENNIRVALVKHAHHDFDVDKPGKDSYELRKAGAGQVLIASANRRALMFENPVVPVVAAFAMKDRQENNLPIGHLKMLSIFAQLMQSPFL